MAPVVPCPVVVGRAAEMATMTAALDAAVAGRGGVAFVVGEAGMGKSRLVHELAGMAIDRGAVVLRGRAVPGSSTAAFRPLAEALAALLPATELDDDELGPWLPALAGVVPTLALSATGVETSAPVRSEAILRLLHAASGQKGVLLVLEDLQWADPETIAVVEHLSDNLQRVPVLCVATVRSEEESAARDLVHRVASRRTAEVVELTRLNDAQVAAMVFNCASDATKDAIARVMELSDGVPFLVEEMLVSPGLPVSLADGVRTRLATLPESHRQVLLTAAAFGTTFDWRLLPMATGLDEAEVVDALERGVTSQLLAVEGEGFRFRHALTGEAVFQSVIPPRRRALAAAALAALDGTPDDGAGDRRQAAARLAERAGHSHRAGRLNLQLGEEALERGALHTAVVALERAATLLEGSEEQDVARERLVEALTHVGRVDDALALGQGLVERLPSERAAAVLLHVAGAGVTAARWELADRLLSEARELVKGSAPAGLQAELAIREAELALGTNDRVRAEHRSEAALVLSRRERLPEPECAALQLLGRCGRRSSIERAEAWFREGLATAEANGLPIWRMRALHEIGTIGLLERSEVDTLLEAQAAAESLGAMATAAILDVELAAGYAGLQDLDAEERHGRRAIRRGTELGLALVVAHGWLHVAGPAAMRGDAEGAEQAATAARASVPGNRDIEGLLVGACELTLVLIADDLAQALDAAERCTQLLRGSDSAPPAHFRAAWPLLLAAQQRADEVPDAIDELERAGLVVSGPARGCLTMARAAVAGRNDPELAAALAVDADRLLACVPFYRHISRRLVAAVAARDGWAVPDEWLPGTEEWLRSQGYGAVADSCAALSRRSPSGLPPEWSRLGVTPREADVLALVIEGCSNRDIADRLYLSVRTVEKHVESLLRKTGTRTRTQLARVATAT